MGVECAKSWLMGDRVGGGGLLALEGVDWLQFRPIMKGIEVFHGC